MKGAGGSSWKGYSLKAAMVSSIVSNSWMISEEGILIVYGNMWWVKGNERVGLRRCDEYIYIYVYIKVPRFRMTVGRCREISDNDLTKNVGIIKQYSQE